VSGLSSCRSIFADIRLSHSVFALPFAAIGLLIGTRGRPPGLGFSALVVLAMVLARSAAMAFNRLADHRFDETNPRTEGRALPSGRVSRGAMITFLIVCSGGFILVASRFGTLCLALSPLVLVALFAYSLTKRFTILAHGFVGFALALSPPAAYLAARGSIDPDVTGVLWVALAVLLWVTGFDIIYACQDVEHDRAEHLHSIPASLGVPRALFVARLVHVGMIVALCLAVSGQGWGTLSWVAVGLVTVLLVIEHSMVSPNDLSRVNASFFTVNGIVSIAFSALVMTDIALRATQLWP
jgi:4-hydroxybenzoate polyprenyltransferase